MMALPHSGGGASGRGRAEVLAAILGDSPSGRLYKALVDNKKAVAPAWSRSGDARPGLSDGQRALLQARINRSTKPADLLKTVEALSTSRPAKDEVERAKTRS